MKRFILLIMLLPCTVFANSFFEEHSQGWFWYDDPKLEKKQKTAPASPQYDPTEEMEQFRKMVDRKLNLAILRPTEENLRNYANTYFEVARRAQHFTDAYKLMLLKNPQYDYSVQHPMNHNARIVHEQIQTEAIEASIKQLATTHGFFFFFTGHCPYCKIFSPTVKRFAERYGISIMAVSIDGSTLPEFPNAIRDNGASRALKVTSWPSLFAVNPKTNQVMPLTNGAVSVSDLEETVFKYAEFTKNYGSLNEK